VDRHCQNQSQHPKQQVTSNFSCDSCRQTDNPDVAVLQTQRTKEPEPTKEEVARILRLHVPLIVKLAERKLPLSEVMRLGAGAIIEFSKSSEEPLELLVSNKTIGVGETVKVGENFGIRITQIGDVKQLIAALGSGKS
jgi:flagellar motor switch protein FliN/FliY